MINRPRKIKFFAADVWKTIWVFKKKKLPELPTRSWYSRSSVVPRLFAGYCLRIHTGRRWKERFISKWAVGFKFGALTWNRKPAIYKAKQMRKKKNKMKNKMK